MSAPAKLDPASPRTTWVWRSRPDREIAELRLQALGQLRLFGQSFREERYVYVEVSPKMVRRRREAQLARASTARRLRIPRPPMRFFASLDNALEFDAREVRFCTSAPVCGLTDLMTGEVWILATLPPRRIVETVAHELMQ